MERRFALKGILENKKRFAMTFLVLVLAAFLLLFCSVLRSCLNRTIVEDRYNTYGMFTHYIEEDMLVDISSKLRTENCISSTGTMTRCGIVDGVNIGYADEAALDLGRIHLSSGRMPEAADEIALEPTILLANGYTTELGQSIRLTVQGVPHPEIFEEPKTAEVEFVLCGVVKEYTVMWGFGLGGFISESGTNRLTDAVGTVKQKTFLLKASERPPIGGMQTNRNAYPKESLQNVTTLLGYAVWMIAAVSSAVLVVCIVFSVLKRTETWRFFRDLGAEKGQIQRIVLWEGLFLSATALPVGALLGIAIAILLTFILPSPAGDQWYIALNAADILCMLGLSVVSAGVGVTVPSCLVRKTPLLVGDRKVRVRKYRKRKDGLGFLSVLRLMQERMRFQSSMTAILICILFSCGIISALAIHLISYNTEELGTVSQYAQNGEIIYDRNVDRVDGMYDNFVLAADARYYGIPWDGDALQVRSETIEEIESLYGVEKVHQYMIKEEDHDFNAIAEYYENQGIDFGRDSMASNEGNWESLYNCNTFDQSFGGISYLLYADFSKYDKSDYFAAYISAEQARAASCLVHYQEMIFQVDMLFGKAMSYWQDHATVPGQISPVKVENGELDVDEYYADKHIVQWNEMVPDTSNCNVTVWGVEGEEADLLIHSSEGKVNMNAFSSGKECVLVLPDIYFTQKESSPEPDYPPVRLDTDSMEYYYKYERRDVGFDFELQKCLFDDSARLQGYEVFSEDLVRVGDVISVKYLDETVEIKIGAILRELPKDAECYPYTSLRPYTIITGEDFFDRIAGFYCPDAYECITVELNGKQPSSVVEQQIGQIVKPLKDQTYLLSNLDLSMEALEQEAMVNISTLLLFAVLYFAVVLVVLSIIFSISMESQRRRIAVLRALGMEVKKIQLSYLIESLFYSVIGFAGAVPVMLTVWGIVQYKTFGNSGPWLSYIVSNGCLNFMWWAYGLVFLAVTVGVLCTLYLPLRKFFKDNIIEQLQS